MKELQTRSSQLAVLDVQMPGMDGIQLLEQIGRRSPDTALECIKKGACDYITKPFSLSVQVKNFSASFPFKPFLGGEL